MPRRHPAQVVAAGVGVALLAAVASSRCWRLSPRPPEEVGTRWWAPSGGPSSSASSSSPAGPSSLASSSSPPSSSGSPSSSSSSSPSPSSSSSGAPSCPRCHLPGVAFLLGATIFLLTTPLGFFLLPLGASIFIPRPSILLLLTVFLFGFSILFLLRSSIFIPGPPSSSSSLSSSSGSPSSFLFRPSIFIPGPPSSSSSPPSSSSGSSSSSSLNTAPLLLSVTSTLFLSASIIPFLFLSTFIFLLGATAFLPTTLLLFLGFCILLLGLFILAGASVFPLPTLLLLGPPVFLLPPSILFLFAFVALFLLPSPPDTRRRVTAGTVGAVRRLGVTAGVVEIYKRKTEDTRRDNPCRTTARRTRDSRSGVTVGCCVWGC
ncbi:A-agglutinin anchorage subunit-like [Numida meleagris]|uniref:A-agglutinin anchorage subunit-like n=1 Tax=Numida meleagris TaxID=8996 RepID=UPI000B3DC79C|nr:A-agglutinin anchorage subunit-like [Numida meleagris]